MYNRNTSISSHRGSYISISRTVCTLPEVPLSIEAEQQGWDPLGAARVSPPVRVALPPRQSCWCLVLLLFLMFKRCFQSLMPILIPAAAPDSEILPLSLLERV